MRWARHSKRVVVLAVFLVFSVAVAGCSTMGPATGGGSGGSGSASTPGLGWTALDEPVNVPEDGPLANLDGSPSGGFQVVNIWATWCAPCRVEMPILEKAFADRGIDVVGVSIDTDPGAASDFMREVGATYPNIEDAKGELVSQLASDLSVPGYPFSLVVVDGEIRAVHVGEFDDAGNVAEASDYV